MRHHLPNNAHAVFDVVVDEVVEFFSGEVVVAGKDAIAHP